MSAVSQESIKPPPESYGRLFLRFLRFGFLAWGGPVAQIAMIRQELVEEDTSLRVVNAFLINDECVIAFIRSDASMNLKHLMDMIYNLVEKAPIMIWCSTCAR